MNTKLSYRPIALLMAFLMFSSSIGFSMDFHFCGNELKTFSFFGDADVCEKMLVKQENESTHACCKAKEKATKSCHNNKLSKGDCCHNESIVFTISGEFESSDTPLELVQHSIVAVPVLFPNLDLFKTSSNQIDCAFYHPPPLTKDISILHQVFRI